MGQPRAKTGAKLRPNRANIGQQQQQQPPPPPQQQQQHNNNNTSSGSRVCFCRRPAVRRKPHKSGRRPRGRARGIAGGLRLVTEGYIGWPPLPPTTSYLPRVDSGSLPVHPVFTIIVVIYSVFCVWCSKNIVFYRVLWPSPSPGFILATLKNHGFFMVLNLRKGSGTENWTSGRPWCQRRANIGQDVGYMGQHKAKIGASLRQHRANIGQDVGYMGRHKGYMGQHKAKIGASRSLRQHRANIGQDVGYMGRHKAKIGTT